MLTFVVRYTVSCMMHLFRCNLVLCCPFWKWNNFPPRGAKGRGLWLRIGKRIEKWVYSSVQLLFCNFQWTASHPAQLPACLGGRTAFSHSSNTADCLLCLGSKIRTVSLIICLSDTSKYYAWNFSEDWKLQVVLKFFEFLTCTVKSLFFTGMFCFMRRRKKHCVILIWTRSACWDFCQWYSHACAHEC